MSFSNLRSLPSEATPEPTAPPPTAPLRKIPSQQSTRMSLLERILEKYEITIADANDLVVLEDYDIVFLADDSGSMQLCSVPIHERKLGAQMPSRWDELCDTIRAVAELACCFDSDGIDIHFLNRPAIHNINNINDPRLISTLSKPPTGGTPLTEVLQSIITQYSTTEKPILMLIATDGEPNGGPHMFKRLISKTLNKQNTHSTFRFQILACTEDDEQVSWLNDFDDATQGIDVTDDYYSEKFEVLSAGRVTKFNRFDWVVKALLGPISSKYDCLDQKKKKFFPRSPDFS